MDHNLIIRPTGKFGSRGERYEVLLGDEVIVTGNAPEFSACRALQNRGLSGTVNFWREGKKHWDFRIQIAKGAERTVMENAKNGPRVVKWSPYEVEDA